MHIFFLNQKEEQQRTATSKAYIDREGKQTKGWGHKPKPPNNLQT